MLNIILSEGKLAVSDFGTIRITENGWISVFDLISVCSDSKNKQYPHKVWYRWKSDDIASSEVIPKCDNFKFPGRGQKETPICDRLCCLL